MTGITAIFVFSAGLAFPPSGFPTAVSVSVSMAADEPSNRSRHDRAVDAIEAGDYDVARELIHEGLKERSARRKDEWRIVEVRLLLATGDPKLAGFKAMRLTVLRPKTKQFAAALYLTGKAYEEIGRSSVALQLYRECLDQETCSGSLKRAAEDRLGRLENKN